MGTFLKQPKQKSKPKQSKSATKTEDTRVVVTGPDTGHMRSPSLQHDINHVAGLGDVEASLDWIAEGIGRLTNDNHNVNLSLSTGCNSYPVKLSIADCDGNDMTDRLVTALERIADAVASLAGLSRPRLECWHEQNEYEPLYKDIAVDGGAPGPKQ